MKKENQNTAANEAKEEIVSICLSADGIGPFLEGAINGVVFRIPTGKVVDVPKRIAALIRESRSALEEGADAVSAYRNAGGRRIG